MAEPTSTVIREHLAALAHAAKHEVEELQNTPLEMKLRQLQVMMGAARLLESDAQREVEELEARARWKKLYQAFCA